MFMPRYRITESLLRDLTAIEVIKKDFQSLEVSSAHIASLRKTAKIASTHYSTCIEGNSLAFGDVERAVAGAKRLAATREEREVRAYYDALTEVEGLVEGGREIDGKTIQRLHALVEGRKKPTPWRNGQNAVRDGLTGGIVYLPPEAEDVPALMEDLVSWIRGSSDLAVPIVAGIVHYQFVTIHPYFDGNGRTARLLATLIMRRGGYDLGGVYSLEEYYANDLPAYYRALDVGGHHNYYFGRVDADVISWLEYFAKGVFQSFSKVREVVAQPSPPDLLDLRELDPRQRKVMGLFYEFREVSAAQVSQWLAISPRSAAQLCRTWVDEGFLTYGNPSRKARSYLLAPRYEGKFAPGAKFHSEGLHSYNFNN